MNCIRLCALVTLCLKKRTPAINMTYFTNSQRLLIIFGRERERETLFNSQLTAVNVSKMA